MRDRPESLPPAPAPSRPRVSHRISLVVAVPLVVALTGIGVATNTYLSTRTAIRALVTSLFAHAADQTSERARAHLAKAPPAVDLLAALFAADAVVPEPDDAARRLLAVMRANPGFAWATFARADGSVAGVHRLADGALVVKESHIEGGQTHATERTVVSDAEWAPRTASDEDTYDARTRPFFRRATAEKRRVWIEPYVFFHEGIPGITCAAPVYATDGTLRGVVTVDFDLRILSEYVGNLHTSEHSRLFIYTSGGALVADPAIHVAGQAGRGAAGELVTRESVTDPLLRAYFASGDTGAFTLNGTRYLAATRAFEPDRGLAWRVGVVAPESDFMAGVERATLFAVLASLAAVLAAAGFSVLLIAVPLAHLSAGMEKVGRFELDGDGPPPSVFREIHAMYRALAAMKSGLSSFASYVPRDVVRAVIRSGESAVLGGKTKRVTVFFSDLAGFTSLAEKMPPTELVALLGVYFDEMTQLIGRHGGTVDKFIGDAIMAFWNAPSDDPDHAANACLAALACKERLDAMRASDPRMALLSARIGVATGEVVVGNIGSHERLNYTVMGDTANLASRLEGLNKMYGTSILVSEATYEAAGARVVMRAVDLVSVKGKAVGVRVYEPLATAPDEGASARAKLAEAALTAYVARRFEDAAAGFAEMLAASPADRAAETMKRRAEGYVKSPPPESWDGVAVMTEK